LYTKSILGSTLCACPFQTHCYIKMDIYLALLNYSAFIGEVKGELLEKLTK
jgi:hypothetical protein